MTGANGKPASLDEIVLRQNERSLQVTMGSQVRSNETVGKRLLNVREASQYLGLDIDTIYKKSRLRELPSVKVGRALRFDVKALERFIERNAKPIL
jgi:excisionase family DNA binding protein